MWLGTWLAVGGGAAWAVHGQNYILEKSLLTITYHTYHVYAGITIHVLYAVQCKGRINTGGYRIQQCLAKVFVHLVDYSLWHSVAPTTLFNCPNSMN